MRPTTRGDGDEARPIFGANLSMLAGDFPTGVRRFVSHNKGGTAAECADPTSAASGLGRCIHRYALSNPVWVHDAPLLLIANGAFQGAPPAALP